MDRQLLEREGKLERIGATAEAAGDDGSVVLTAGEAGIGRSNREAAARARELAPVSGP